MADLHIGGRHIDWKEWLHPRDWRGRFIEKGSSVSLPGGLHGTVVSDTPTREDRPRMEVRLSDGRTGLVPVDEITVDAPLNISAQTPNAINEHPLLPAPGQGPFARRRLRKEVEKTSAGEPDLLATALNAQTSIAVDQGWHDIPEENRKHITDTIQRAYAMFGDLGVQRLITDLTPAMKAMGAEQAYDTVNDSLYFRKGLLSMDMRSSQAMLGRERGIRQWAHDNEGDVLKVTMSHELGHALDARIGGGNDNRERISIPREVLLDHKAIYGINPRIALSGYGMMDTQGWEAIAEAFGDVVTNGRYAAPASLDIIDRYLKNSHRPPDAPSNIPHSVDEALQRVGEPPLPTDVEMRHRFFQRGSDARIGQVRASIRRQIESDTGVYDYGAQLAPNGKQTRGTTIGNRVVNKRMSTGERAIATFLDPNAPNSGYVIVRDPTTGAQRAVSLKDFARDVGGRRGVRRRRVPAQILPSSRALEHAKDSEYAFQPTAPTGSVRLISASRPDPATPNEGVQRITNMIRDIYSGRHTIKQSAERQGFDVDRPEAGFIIRDINSWLKGDFQPQEIEGVNLRYASDQDGYQIRVVDAHAADDPAGGSASWTGNKEMAQSAAYDLEYQLAGMDPTSSWGRVNSQKVNDHSAVDVRLDPDADVGPDEIAVVDDHGDRWKLRVVPDRRRLDPELAKTNPMFRPIVSGEAQEGDPNHYSHTGNARIDKIWKGLVGMIFDGEIFDDEAGNMAHNLQASHDVDIATIQKGLFPDAVTPEEEGDIVTRLLSNRQADGEAWDWRNRSPAEVSGIAIRNRNSDEGYQVIVQPISKENRSTNVDETNLGHYVAGDTTIWSADRLAAILSDVISKNRPQDWAELGDYSLSRLDDGHIIVTDNFGDQFDISIREDRRRLDPEQSAKGNVAFRPIKRDTSSGGRGDGGSLIPSARAGREIPKELREIVNKQIDSLGWRYVPPGRGGHAKLFPSNRSFEQITLPATAGDRRAMNNIITRIRRAGGVWP